VFGSTFTRGGERREGRGAKSLLDPLFASPQNWGFLKGRGGEGRQDVLFIFYYVLKLSSSLF